MQLITLLNVCNSIAFLIIKYELLIMVYKNVVFNIWFVFGILYIRKKTVNRVTFMYIN
jgi:hypothetical protein